MIDLAIVGSGPAAMSAAIYAARAGLKVQIYEKGNMGGTLPQIAEIENYPGFLGTGSELADKLKAQAKQFGVQLAYGECTQVETGSLTVDGEKVSARAILIATGSEPRPLDIEGITRPVSYCALCDGALYKDKRVVIVGGGNSALQESLHLAELAKEVTILSRSKVKAEPYLVQKLADNTKLIENATIDAETLNSYDGIFVFIGKRPATTFLDKKLLTADGYIKADDFETALPGVFAAGDVRDGTTKQIVTAAADGADAAIKITEFLRQN